MTLRKTNTQFIRPRNGSRIKPQRDRRTKREETNERTGYEDEIKGVLFDENGRSFFVFTRIGTGLYKFFHVLAQPSSGEVFIVQKAEVKGIFKKNLIVTMEDIDGGLHLVTATNKREPKEGLLITCLACATERTRTEGPDSLPKDWWESFDV